MLLTPDDDRPLRPVRCQRCATVVLARKLTPTQTTIQWLADAGQVCEELAACRAAGRPPGRVAGCQALGASIDSAVREGRLEVLHQ